MRPAPDASLDEGRASEGSAPQTHHRGTSVKATYLMVFGFVAFYIGWHFYSRYIAEKVFKLDPNFQTPAHAFEDVRTMCRPTSTFCGAITSRRSRVRDSHLG